MERWFTPQERGVILFLVAILVVGSAIYVYKLKNPYFAPELRIQEPSKVEVELHKLIHDTEIALKTTKSVQLPREKLASQHKLVNINKAGKEELMELPGIGPVYAQRIIDYRKKYGGFKKIDELIQIKGIGEKKFEKLKSRITIK